MSPYRLRGLSPPKASTACRHSGTSSKETWRSRRWRWRLIGIHQQIGDFGWLDRFVEVLYLNICWKSKEWLHMYHAIRKRSLNLRICLMTSESIFLFHSSSKTQVMLSNFSRRSGLIPIAFNNTQLLVSWRKDSLVFGFWKSGWWSTTNVFGLPDIRRVQNADVFVVRPQEINRLQ